MTTTWIFSPTSDSRTKPAIGGQLLSLSGDTLCLRNPWVTDSVFMGKLYCALIIVLIIFLYPDLLSNEAWEPYTFSPILLIGTATGPFIFLPFLIYRIYFIKHLSSFCLNRSTQKIYYRRLSKVLVFEWSNTGGGIFKRTEYGGSSFSTGYALAFTRAVVVSSIDIVRLPEMRSCFISSTCAMPLFKYFCASWLNGFSVMACSVIR